jgi:hypothetical protein
VCAASPTRQQPDPSTLTRRRPAAGSFSGDFPATFRRLSGHFPVTFPAIFPATKLTVSLDFLVKIVNMMN